MSTCLVQLPSEVLTDIAVWLDIGSVAQLAATCKLLSKVVRDNWTWHRLLLHRFGRAAVPESLGQESVDYREAYRRLSKPELLIATSFDIVHNHAPYWSTIPLSEGSRTVAWLESVCWLHLWGTLRSVSRGRYRVIWTLYTDGMSFNAGSIVFHAQVKDQGMSTPTEPDEVAAADPGHIQYRIGQRLSQQITPDLQLVEYTMPQTLVVSPSTGYDYADVELSIEGKNNQWKGRMGFYAVRLERSSETESDTETLDTSMDPDTANDNVCSIM